MAQHDQVIDNGSGATVRADMNAALAALFSSSSGPIEPATTVAGQPWFDTGVASAPVLRIRNLANTGWLVLLDAQQLGIDISDFKRAGPPNDSWVWNDRGDMSGTDVMTLDDTGNLFVTGGVGWYDAARQLRSLLSNNLSNDSLELAIYNAAGTLLNRGPILTTGNSPFGAGGVGYQKLATGLMMNWGSGDTDVNGNLGFSFAATFPNGVSALVATPDTITGVGGDSAYIVSASSIQNAGGILQARSTDGRAVAAWADAHLRWIAVGW